MTTTTMTVKTWREQERTVTSTLLRTHKVKGRATNALGLDGDLTVCGKIIVRDMGARDDAKLCPWCFDL